jgi:hypothetical protein
MTGEATADEDQEPFTLYAETEEQHIKLAYCEELIAVLNKAHIYKPILIKQDVTLGLI